MSYVMEAAIEAERLERQARQGNYSIVEELKAFRFRPNERVLDAGCGTGVHARYLVEGFGLRCVDGMDASELRLRQATELLDARTREAMRFHRQDLASIDPSFHARYDTVICRYVIEHVPDPVRVLRELRKTLRPGGRLIVIELDGVFVNLHSGNERFNRDLAKVRSRFDFDPEIGRKVPGHLKRAGFSGIEWDAKLLTFRGETLREEYENNVRRFAAIEPFLLKVFGSKRRADAFRDLYLSEMMKEENVTAFSKWIVTAMNPVGTLAGGDSAG
jgi:SAM-dependent methyltransferase